MLPEPVMFELNGTTLAGIGAVLGALVGALSFVFRQLIVAKDSQISDLKGDRDYWRDFSMTMIQANEKVLSIAESEPPPARARTSRAR